MCLHAKRGGTEAHPASPLARLLPHLTLYERQETSVTMLQKGTMVTVVVAVTTLTALLPVTIAV